MCAKKFRTKKFGFSSLRSVCFLKWILHSDKDYLSDENGSVAIPFADEDKDAELIIVEDLDSFGSAT